MWPYWPIAEWTIATWLQKNNVFYMFYGCITIMVTVHDFPDIYGSLPIQDGRKCVMNKSELIQTDQQYTWLFVWGHKIFSLWMTNGNLWLNKSKWTSQVRSSEFVFVLFLKWLFFKLNFGSWKIWNHTLCSRDRVISLTTLWQIGDKLILRKKAVFTSNPQTNLESKYRKFQIKI